MRRCDRFDQHLFFPCVPDEAASSCEGVEPVCLTCLEAAVPTVSLSEVISTLRWVVGVLPGAPCEATTLTALNAIGSRALRRLGAMQMRSSTPSMRGDRQPPHATLATAYTAVLTDYYVSLSEAWALGKWKGTQRRAGDPVGAAEHYGYEREAARADLSHGSQCSTRDEGYAVLGATQGSAALFTSPRCQQPATQGLAEHEGLHELVQDVLCLFQDALRDWQKPEAAVFSTILVGVVERSRAFRRCLVAAPALLRFYVCDTFQRHILLRQGGQTLEESTFLLSLLFTEAAGRPAWLEALAAICHAPGAANETEVSAALNAQETAEKDGHEGLCAAFAAALEHNRDADVISANVLSLLHFLLSHATTARLIPHHERDCALRSVAPFVLSAVDTTCALACDVVRLMMVLRLGPDTAAALNSNAPSDVGMVWEWVEGYALEALQRVTASSACAVVHLLDTIAAGQQQQQQQQQQQEASGADSPAAPMTGSFDRVEHLAGGGAERLSAFCRVARFSVETMRLVLDSAYVTHLVLHTGLSVEEVGDFVEGLLYTHALGCDDGDGTESDAVESATTFAVPQQGQKELSRGIVGSHTRSLGRRAQNCEEDEAACSLHLPEIVALATLLMKAAHEDVSAIAPEHAGCLTHALSALLTRYSGCLKDDADTLERAHTTDNGIAAVKPDTPSLRDIVPENLLPRLLRVLAFYLPVAPELCLVARLALTDVVKATESHPLCGLAPAFEQRTAAASLLCMATQLVKNHFTETTALSPEALVGLPATTTRPAKNTPLDMVALTRAGLLDALLSFSARVLQLADVDDTGFGTADGTHHVRMARLALLQTLTAKPADEVLECPPRSVEASLLSSADSIAGVVESLCFCGEATPAADDMAALGGRMLCRLAALGSQVPLCRGTLDTILADAYRRLCSLGEEASRYTEDLSSDGICRVTEHFLSVGIARLHWGGDESPFTGMDAVLSEQPIHASPASSSTTFSRWCADAGLGKAALLAMERLNSKEAFFRGPSPVVPLPRVVDVLRALSAHSWSVSFVAHVCLTTALYGESAAEVSVGDGTAEGTTASRSVRLAVQLITSPQSLDKGTSMLRTAFAMLQRQARDWRPSSQPAEARPDTDGQVKLVVFLTAWFTSVVAAAGRTDAGLSAARVAESLLVNHGLALLLAVGVGERTLPRADEWFRAHGAVARVLTRLFTACLCQVPRSQGALIDRPLLQWCACYARCESCEGGGDMVLLLLCLLQERGRVPEAAVMRTLEYQTSTTTSPSLQMSVLAGIIRFQNALLQPEGTVTGGGGAWWFQWHQYIPVRQLACLKDPLCGEQEVSKDQCVMLHRAQALVVQACDVVLHRARGRRAVPSQSDGASTAARIEEAHRKVTDGEFRSACCILDWALEMLGHAGSPFALSDLSPVVARIVPLTARQKDPPRAEGRDEEEQGEAACALSAGRVVHFLLRAYGAHLCYTSQVTSLALLVDVAGGLGQCSQGWVLAGLLHVAAGCARSWDGATEAVDMLMARHAHIVAATRAFLATFDLPTVPTTRTDRQSREEFLTMLPALQRACEQYATVAMAPDAEPFPLHRIQDFLLTSARPPTRERTATETRQSAVTPRNPSLQNDLYRLLSNLINEDFT